MVSAVGAVTETGGSGAGLFVTAGTAMWCFGAGLFAGGTRRGCVTTVTMSEWMGHTYTASPLTSFLVGFLLPGL